MQDGGLFGTRYSRTQANEILRACAPRISTKGPFYVFLATPDFLSGFSEITEARYPAKLRVNHVTCGDSFRVDAAEYTLKPDSHDEISLGSFSRDAARAAKA